MRVFNSNTLVLAGLLLLLVFPTSAAIMDGVMEGGLELRPHDGPNGQYAQIDGSDQLTVDLGDNLNPDAVTTFEGVFDILNTGPDDILVWISHNSTANVEFRTDEDGSIQGPTNSTVLSPGEHRVVGIVVDSHGASPGTTLIENIHVHARTLGDEPPGGEPSDSSQIPVDRDPGDTILDRGHVRVELDQARPSENPMTIIERDGLPDSSESFGIRAAIDPSAGAWADVPEDRLEALEADGVVNQGDDVVLSGRETVVDTPGAIAPNREVIAVYDFRVAQQLRNERGTVWITLPRYRFEETDPAEVQIIRQRDAGWSLLDTNVARTNDSHVVLTARTSGLSRIAVLPGSDVSFEWSGVSASQRSGADVTVPIGEPGVTAANLSVTDGFDRRDNSTYRLLVNDQPEVTIDAPETITAGEPVTMHASVNDSYGETRVTWYFDDRRPIDGRTVNRSFDAGQHDVTVRVVDEFGANSTAERRIAVGQQSTIVRLVEYPLGVEGRLALIALVTLLVLVVGRWLLKGDRR